jgi:hypothetical protein
MKRKLEKKIIFSCEGGASDNEDENVEHINKKILSPLNKVIVTSKTTPTVKKIDRSNVPSYIN